MFTKFTPLTKQITRALQGLALCLSTTTALAQSVILETYIHQGLEANLQLRNSDLAVARSLEDIRQAKGLSLPSAGMEATYTRASGGRRIEIPVGDLVNPVYLTLNQLTQSNQFPQINNVREQFLPDNFHDTRLRIVQPLFQTEIRFQKLLSEQAADIPAATRAALAHQLKYDIKTAYFQYLQSLEALGIFQSAIGVVEAQLRVTRALQAQEKVTRDAVLNVEYALSKVETERTNAQKQVALSAAMFNFRLQRNLTDSIMVDSTLWQSPPPPLPALDTLFATALRQRQEPNQIAAASRVNATLQDMQEQSRKLPSLALALDAGAQGFGYTFGSDQWYALAAVQLNWPLFKGFRRSSEAQETRIAGMELANQAVLLQQQIQLEVLAAQFELDAAQQALIQANKAVDAAVAAFQIVNRKYEQNQALQLEWFDAQNKVTAAAISRSLAHLEIHIRHAHLMKAAGL